MKLNCRFVAFAVALVAPVSFGFQDDPARPLPAIETVLERVAEQAQKEDDERTFKQHYSYTRNRVTEYRDSEGELKKREEKKRDNRPKPAPPASASQPAKTKTERKAPATEGQFNQRDKAFEKDEFALTEDLLKRFEFTLVGRESVQGRSTFVVDFKPISKHLPERNFKDKFVNKAAGRVWVDEEDYALAKADLRLTERVNVIGGLVGSVWKFNYTFERERTEDGLWFARTVNWHLEGREVFFRRTIDYHEEKSDVKRAWQFESASK